MTTVFLKPKKEESLKRFHLWVFSGAIARVLLDASHKGDAPVEGELVCVRSSANEILGVGHWQIGSIAVRILGTDFWLIGYISPETTTVNFIVSTSE